MKTTSVQKRKAYLVMGGMGLFFAVGYLGMSFQFPFGQLDQPGAAFDKVLLSMGGSIGGLFLLVKGYYASCRAQGKMSPWKGKRS
jgi:hypothetical protein